MPKLEFRDYYVEVYDPDEARRVSYDVRAVSVEHADRQARDGYTGLLGGEALREIQDRLEVTVF